MSHLRQFEIHGTHNPGDPFNVKVSLQLVEKCLFVDEHVRAFISLQTTQSCPFYMAKPSKQLVQID